MSYRGSLLILRLNYSVKIIKLLKAVSDYKEFNIRETA